MAKIFPRKKKDKSKNVFISHYHKDEENIHRLKKLLEPKGYRLKNSSIDSTKPNQATDPDYIRRLLRLRIHWSGTFICMIGPKTHTREWVDWEIEQAAKKGKRIVGVYVNGIGQDQPTLPKNFEKYADALVGWTGDRIIDAIEGKLNNWYCADGSLREPVWATARSNC